MSKAPFTRERLFCPGPTPVSDAAKLAAVSSSVYHRTDSFSALFLECRRLLGPVFGTKGMPLILTSSGSGAMESAMVNLTNQGDQVLCIRGGKFGDRWVKMANAYQCQTEVFEVEWGQSVDLNAFKSRIKALPNLKAVFFQANETSTGVFYPVQQIVAAVKELSPESLVVVDAISGLAAHKIEMDEWRIDCMVSGSQKGFGIPPGLAFIHLSDSAWQKLSQRSRFYFDLEREKKGQEKGNSAWTPATTLIASLHVALTDMNNIGINQVAEHHKRLADAVRRSLQKINLQLFAEKDQSNAVTSMRVPEGVDGLSLLKRLRNDYGAIFAGGQDHLKGKIVRFSTLGFVDQFEIVAGMAALEMALFEEGHKFDLGDGVKHLVQQLARS